MAKKAELIGEPKMVSYTPIHPALDFFELEGNKIAIVSVGKQLRYDYVTGDVDFRDGELTILSTGEKFVFSKKELANRSLYYARGMDLPMSRWNTDDIEAFCEEMKNGSCQPVDFSVVHNLIKGSIEEYMDFEDERIYSLLSLFIIYTHFYPIFNSAPILQLWGELKTGKSKICSLLAAMAFNPVNSANISVASVFRLIEGRRSTLILDESEDLMTSERGKEVCNLLLAGYSKGGETYRQEKQNDDRYKTQSFQVFSPKVIANIAGVSLAPLKSRIVRIRTVGAKDKKKANREVLIDDPFFGMVRNKLYRLLLTRGFDVIEAREKLPDAGLNDRTLAIWSGILSIASLVGKPEYKEMLAYAKDNFQIMQEELDSDNIGQSLVKKLLGFVERHGDGEYSTMELLEYFAKDDETNFSSTRGMGIALTRLGFKSKPHREEGTGVLRRFYTLVSRDILKILDRF